MELMSHEVAVHPSASPYQSAPTSPSCGMKFYTAPSSPAKEGLLRNGTFDHSDDEFEFSTSRKFGDYIELEIRENLEYFLEDDQPQIQKQQQQGKVKRERGGSLPTMAFADELFYNGLVMPLKPPPRFQSKENASFTQGSVPSSPKSPQSSSFIKVPFIHKAAWNDDFDPFKVALQKVSEESRGRTSNGWGGNHRRTRSHSPFRTNSSGRWNDDQHEEKSRDEKLDDQKILGQKFGLPKEPKGSPYARFVIDQNKQVEEMAKGRKRPQKMHSGRRTRPGKTNHDQNGVIEGINYVVVESGMKRIRNIFLKYASFGRENSEDKGTNTQSNTSGKSSYFKKLSFKIKGNNINASTNVKKRGIEEEPKMQVVEYKRNKPSLALCLGYGFENHKNMDYSL